MLVPIRILILVLILVLVLASQSQQLLAALDAHGALLLRGWAVSSAEEFAAAMRALPLKVCTEFFPSEPNHHLPLTTCYQVCTDSFPAEPNLTILTTYYSLPGVHGLLPC